MEQNFEVFKDMHENFTFRFKITRMHHLRQFTEDLPIYSKKKEFLRCYKEHQVIIFKSNAGSGKSTQLPQYMIDCVKGRILVTEPRVIAAENVARRVREEWGIIGKEANPKLIGFVSGPNYDIDPSLTQVIYMSEVTPV